MSLLKLDNTQLKGWVQAFVAILVFLGINTVMGRYSAVVLDVNPIIYSCSAFSSCALILLAIGGSGSLAKETMRSVDTWVYGTILMMSYIIGMLLFSYVTATEGTMLQKVGVLLGLLGGWFFLDRKPDIYQVIGTAVITGAVVLVCFGLEGQNIGTIYLLAFLYGSLQVARIFVAELHRPHNKAVTSKDPKAKARVVGFVMFIISVIFLLLAFIIALAQLAQTGAVIDGLPVMADFFHAPTIFAGMIAGVFIVAPSRMLEFSASNIIKAENFTTVTALSFVSTIFWEWATSPITGLSIKDVSSLDILAGTLITIGGLFVAFTRGLKRKDETWKDALCIETQNLDAVEDSREIVANTIEHYDGCVKQSAKALDINTSAIEAMLADEKKVLAFKPDVLKDVARLYRKKVAMCDALTGLSNRAGFMTALKNINHEIYSILFIDLDKFKPVNDTYGHDAGDSILKGVSERLSELFSSDTLTTRLGGDEFCVLLPHADKNKAEQHALSIQEILAKPFMFEAQEITIGASVGIASYPDDATCPEKLLKLADGGMYKEKKER